MVVLQEAFVIPNVILSIYVGLLYFRLVRSPTDDSIKQTNAALRGLRHIYKAGFRYVKAGIMFTEIIPAGVEQMRLFDPEQGAGTQCHQRSPRPVDARGR